MPVRVGSFDSLDELEETFKRGSGTYMRRIQDKPLVVRFVDEVTDWRVYLEHWDETAQTAFPCSDDCVGCADGMRTSKKFLANVFIPQESQVVPLMMPSTLAQQLFKKAKRYGTMLDRDYELWKDGSGINTTYDSEPLEPSTVRGWAKISKNTLDLTQVLEEALENYLEGGNTGKAQLPGEGKKRPARKVRTQVDEDDDTEDETPRRGGRTGRRPAAKAARPVGRRSTKPVDDDADEEDDEKPRSRRTAATKPGAKRPAAKASTPRRPTAKPKPVDPEPEDDEDIDEAFDPDTDGNEANSDRAQELRDDEGLRGCKRILKETWGFEPPEYRGWDLEQCIDKILELEAGDDGEADDEPQDDDDDFVDDDADEADDEADDEEDEEGLTEDDLLEMSPAELKEIAKQYEIRVTPKMGTKALVAKIMEAAEADEEE